MEDFDFHVQERVLKIRARNEYHDLEHNAYISFSGGKDSCVLSKLIDIALPGNNIPRVFFNTGIEYNDMLQFVRDKAKEDDRIIIYNSGVNIRNMLETKGYPFKSKVFSKKLSVYQHSGNCKTVTNYLGITGEEPKSFQCPKRLKGCFTPDFTLKVSDKCCNELKKKTAARWEKENGKTIIMTGMRKAEGGLRLTANCSVFKEGKLIKFHPLFPVNDEFIEQFIDTYKVDLCKLYKAPYNFKRTGCKGCPFALKLWEQLDVMKKLLPAEYKQCYAIWGKVYKEYERLNYRLKH